MIETRQFTIPESELDFEFVRSSGPGGQRVNKTSTKAQLRWNVDRSAVFTDDEKTRIKEHLANRINKEGEVVISSDVTRSQSQNKELAIELLRGLVAHAIAPVKKRKPTKPTRSSKERRLKEKSEQAKKKIDRRGFIDE